MVFLTTGSLPLPIADGDTRDAKEHVEHVIPEITVEVRVKYIQ